MSTEVALLILAVCVQFGWRLPASVVSGVMLGRVIISWYVN